MFKLKPRKRLPQEAIAQVVERAVWYFGITHETVNLESMYMFFEAEVDPENEKRSFTTFIHGDVETALQVYQKGV